MTYKVWFNHWFSSAYRIIELLKEGYKNSPYSCYIIGTNDKEYCVYKEVCDEFYQEPIFEDEDEYVNWALDFCKTNKISVFFPRRNMVAIARREEEFNELGVIVVLSANYETMELFNDKAKTYREINNRGLANVPDTAVVNNVETFKTAYKTVKEYNPNERIIFKYSVGEGATSFRVIDDKVADISVLDTGAGLKMTYEDAIKLLSSVDTFKDLMVMPYLKGPEISIDCLNLLGKDRENHFVGICRNKLGSRVTEVYQDEKLLEITKNIAEEFNLYGPFNIQFRMHNSIPYLLEINTRMSGGTHLSCMTGINLPYLAMETALSRGVDIPEYKKDKMRVSQIETPINLS